MSEGQKQIRIAAAGECLAYGVNALEGLLPTAVVRRGSFESSQDGGLLLVLSAVIDLGDEAYNSSVHLDPDKVNARDFTHVFETAKALADHMVQQVEERVRERAAQETTIN